MYTLFCTNGGVDGLEWEGASTTMEIFNELKHIDIKGVSRRATLFALSAGPFVTDLVKSLAGTRTDFSFAFKVQQVKMRYPYLWK